MIGRNGQPLPRALALWIAAGVCISVGVLTRYGYSAVRQWQYSSTLLATRRAGETADLFVTAIERDMRAVQTSLLESINQEELTLDTPYDAATLIASSFARYPYPEAFFAWRGAKGPSTALFFDRTDRPPFWIADDASPRTFPVTIRSDAAVAELLAGGIGRDISRARRFSMFETSIGGVPYQVVARLLYSDSRREHLAAVFGFTVNLEWVRKHYFPEITQQMASIGSVRDGFTLSVLDDRDRVVAASGPPGRNRGVRRLFSLVFFDPELIAFDPPVNLSRPVWAVEAHDFSDATVVAAISGADRTLVVAAFSAVMLALALVLTAHATRAGAKIAEMRSDFVASVTHDLKTPLATIRAAGDTMASGRIVSPEALRDYALLVVQESKRLTRLFDNLLAYARITDVTEAYAFEPLIVSDLIDDLTQRFRAPLSEQGFAIEVSLAADTPPIRADLTAVELLLDNLMDNAIRYSGARRSIAIASACEGAHVRFDFSDRGVGIPHDELRHVVRRFYRGRRAGSRGSGLGLAIVKRIVEDHGGAWHIQSRVDVGTTVTFTLPAITTENE